MSHLRAVVLVAFALASGCRGTAPEPPEPAEAPAASPAVRAKDPFAPLDPPARPPAHAGREGPTEDGAFVVTWAPSPDPVPLNAMFAVDVTVGAPGALPGDAEVRVDAGMPGHGHGMTVRPETSRREDGRFRAEGLLFHMPGTWELQVVVQAAGRRHVARFAVDLSPVEISGAERAALLALSPKPELPPDPTNAVADDECAARFGQALFFDPRLSGNGKVSCATCHLPGKVFTNGDRFATTIGTTTRHVPTAWNSAFNRWWFWDGRADSAWAQALGPIENQVEMGGSRTGVVHAIAGAPELRSAYEGLFGPLPPAHDAGRFPAHARPDPWERWHPHAQAWKTMSPADQEQVDRVFANVGKAIAAYERRLVGGDAPFDRFVGELREGASGGSDALAPAAQRGAKLFVGKARCLTCHHGPMLTDLEFHDLYLVSAVTPPRDTGRFRGIELTRMDDFNAAGRHSDDPTGEAAGRQRYLVQQPENWGQFKTPSLRNVALTAPYMHDGRFATLDDVLHYYRTLDGAVPPTAHTERTLQRIDITDAEQADLVAFLGSLTDFELPADLAGAPSGPAPPRCR